MSTKEEAQGGWREILPAMGIEEKYLKDAHGPCPLCGGRDRYRWDDGKGQNDLGNGGYYCSQCGAGTGFRLVMGLNRWDYGQAAKAIDKFLGIEFKPDPVRAAEAKARSDKEAKKTASERDYFRQLWRGSSPLTPTDPAWLYLSRRCGDPSGRVSELRFHPALTHPNVDGTFPALLAPMGWNGSKHTGIHRTYLTQDGRKADIDPPRAGFGTKGPIRLGPVAEHMGIAEGIETALAASSLFGIPVWSSVDAHGLETWTPPEGAKSILILGDNDRSFTGQAAAYALAKRLRRLKYEVEVAIPEVPSWDWADIKGAT